MPRRCLREECFGYTLKKNNRCNILTEVGKNPYNCAFFKTNAQYEKDVEEHKKKEEEDGK